MTKRRISLLLSLCMLLSVFSTVVYADDSTSVSTDTADEKFGTCGESITWILDDNGTLTISGTGEMENYFHDNSSPWDSCRAQIKTVVIENGVTSIGSSAFSGCTELTSVIIPDSVTSIGNSAFYYCPELTSVNIPDSVTSIGDDAFKKCTELTLVTIGKSVTNIGFAAFEGCTLLIAVKITDISAWCKIQFTNYYSNPLYYAKKLYLNGSLVENLVIPDSVTSIGDYAFYGYSKLTSVTIPDSVTSIGTGAFHETALYNDSSNWENGVLYIGNHLIKAKPSAISTSYTIKSGTRVIANYAFPYCNELTSIIIPDSVTSIGNSAFYYCTGLTSVIIPNSVTIIGNDAFSYCTGLTSVTIGNSVTIIGDYAFNGCNEIASAIIPDSVTSIGAFAFASCTGITSITIPDSVMSIGSYAFSGCTGITSVIIPDSVKSIGNNAFGGCKDLTSLIIPDSVTSIANHTFSYCKGLTSVTIPNSVTSIGDSAFYYCSGLASITIPDSVTSIGNMAFGYNYRGTIEGFTVIGYVGSAAETYAEENNLIFIDITAPKLPEADSDEYLDTETNTMPNVVAKTTADAIISSLSAYGINATITDKDGNSLANDANIGTGCIVSDQNGNTYTVIVKGDVDGTGIVNSTDYIQIKKMFLGTTSLENEYFIAADTDNTGKINSTDYLQVKKYFLGQIDLYA